MVSTSTKCSAVSVERRSQSTRRCWIVSCEILGTSITCSGKTVSTNLKTSSRSFVICCTGASRVCTEGETSTECSAVCRCTRACGLTPARRSGRVPPSSSSYSEKNSVSPATLGLWLQRASYVALALAVFCPRGAVWWRASARAMATLIRAYLKYARRHRSLRRLAPRNVFASELRPHDVLNDRSRRPYEERHHDNDLEKQ